VVELSELIFMHTITKLGVLKRKRVFLKGCHLKDDVAIYPERF
jgi:hypothetical protein